MQRIQKILAQAGIASRRKSEELIAAGKVTVNGKTATIGQSADSGKDLILVDGKPIAAEKKVYLALNKPKGYVTTVADKFAERKVMDLIKIKERVFPVGRLDADAEGLIFLTNDGDFANRVMHPRYEVEKSYVALLEQPLSKEAEEKIKKGVVIDESRVKADLKFLEGRNVVEITVHEGMHKIVKRIFKSVGNYVKSLSRVRIGHVRLGNLETGKTRNLSPEEVKGFLE